MVRAPWWLYQKLIASDSYEQLFIVNIEVGYRKQTNDMSSFELLIVVFVSSFLP